MIFNRIILTGSLLVAVLPAYAVAPTNEEIWQKLQQIQEQLSEVQQQNKLLKAENEGLKLQVDSNEKLAQEATETAEAVAVATEEAVKNVSLKGNKMSIGGYGELHFNSLDDQNGTADKDEIDFHRFVLFFDYDFTEQLRFVSELELEHSIAGDGQAGAIELEQAYIEYDINKRLRVAGGLFLVPAGINNEMHEPTTFYGTERNPIEKNIIPTTWREAGVMLSGNIVNGFSYDLAVSSGLNTSASSAYKVRSGRQGVAQAVAKDFAYTGRLKWTAIPGLELAATVQYQQDITQSLDSTAGSATLLETHAVFERGSFGLRALYATWDLEGNCPKSMGADEQMGWYIEPSYRFNDNVGIFARYNEWDNQAGNSSDSEYQQTDIGINWWPHHDVVVKLDYQLQKAPAGKKELDGLNIGLGYQF